MIWAFQQQCNGRLWHLNDAQLVPKSGKKIFPTPWHHHHQPELLQGRMDPCFMLFTANSDPSYCCCPISLKLSVHSPLNFDLNKAFCQKNSLDIFLRPFSVNLRNGYVGKIPVTQQFLKYLAHLSPTAMPQVSYLLVFNMFPWPNALCLCRTALPKEQSLHVIRLVLNVLTQ